MFAVNCAVYRKMCLRIFIFVSLNLLVTQCQELDETVSEQLITNEGFKNVYQNWLLAHQVRFIQILLLFMFILSI